MFDHLSQSKKIQHGTTPVKIFTSPDLDLIVIPRCEVQRYCLAMVGSFFGCPDVAPLSDHEAITIDKAFLDIWVSIFDTPFPVTSNQSVEVNKIANEFWYSTIWQQPAMSSSVTTIRRNHCDNRTRAHTDWKTERTSFKMKISWRNIAVSIDRLKLADTMAVDIEGSLILDQHAETLKTIPTLRRNIP